MKHNLRTQADTVPFRIPFIHFSVPRKIFLFLALLLTLLVLVTMHAEAATNYYVRPDATGANNGSDWTNAYTSLSTAVSNVARGNTIYIATGSYGAMSFSKANSGTDVMTIKKATVADHGTDAGWSDSYGIGQATFGNWTITTDYWYFDGQTRNANWKNGGVDQYGIKVYSTAGASHLLITGADYLTFRYIDVSGRGPDSGVYDDIVYGTSGSKDVTFQYCSLRDSSRTIFLMRGCWQNLLVEYSYLARNASNAAEHGEMLSDTCSDNVTFRYNIIEDIEGTAIWAVMNAGSSSTASGSNTADNWKLYGNVINWTVGYHRTGIAYTIFSDHAGSSMNWMNNLAFYNNTINDRNWIQYYGIYILAGSNNVVKNNIFYDTKQSTHVGVSTSYNWYYSAPSGDSGPGTQTCTTNCNIFTNRDGNDLTLSGNNLPNAGDSTVSAEFNTDMDGNLRGSDGVWDRGAYEYGGSGPALRRPSPPQDFKVQ